jgi:catechol 2,3-dioxygenase-like lactoylglutathione lyase family enzyme
VEIRVIRGLKKEISVMKIDHIFETVLYADDLKSAEIFYRDILGLELLDHSDLMLAFQGERSGILAQLSYGKWSGN